MTQHQHTVMALIISLIVYQFIWHTILKHHPVTKKNMMELSDLYDELWDYFKK